jgi:hypothetical protein
MRQLCSAVLRMVVRGAFRNPVPVEACSTVNAVTASSSSGDPMESKPENIGKYVSRHLAQLKILSRLVEHELDAAKGGREVTIDRDLIESFLDTLDIFVEDCEGQTGVARQDRKMAENKPAVARLN